jgi:hypothetical protein
MKDHKPLCEVAKFINLKGEVETGLLRITPLVPGRLKGELPREVYVSATPQPIPKGDK